MDLMKHRSTLTVIACCLLSVPAGCDAEGAPIGLQLIGRADAEDRLLALALEIEAAGRDG